jgi:CrcB protein
VIVVIIAAVAGGFGALVRFGVDSFLRDRPAWSGWTLMIINVTGSAVLGLLTGLVLARAAPGWAQLIIGTGFLGGYTTFSAAAVEVVRRLEERRWSAAVISALGMPAVAAVAAALGLLIGLGR